MFTGQTGPKTENGKSVSRLNALKDGSYSTLLSELKCDFCKRKEVCQFFSSGQKCTLRGEIAKTILVGQLDVTEETKNLYQLSMSNALFDSMFNKKTADKWISQASRQLDRLVDIKAIEKTTSSDENIKLDFSEFRRRLEESKERSRKGITDGEV